MLVRGCDTSGVSLSRSPLVEQPVERSVDPADEFVTPVKRRMHHGLVRRL